MRYVLLLVTLLSYPLLTNAQFNEDDPLVESRIIHDGGGDELIGVGDGISLFKYYKAQQLFARDTLIQVLTWPSGGYNYDIDVGDLDGDALDEIVAAWKTWNANNPIEMVVLQPDPMRLTVDSTNAWKNIVRLNKSNPPQMESAWRTYNGPLIKIGNFDADSLGEFVLAYWADDGMIEITVYDVSDSMTVTVLDSIRDQVMVEPSENGLCEDVAFLFDIEVVDFNGDGIDAIVLSGRRPNAPSGYQVFAHVYTYDQTSGTLNSLASDTLYTQINPQREIGNFNTASGKFYSGAQEQFVVSIFEYDVFAYENGQPDTIANIIIPVAVDENFGELDVGEPVYQRQDTIPHECYYDRSSTLCATDVNNDGIDELFSAFSYDGEFPTCKIFTGNDQPGFSVYADLDTLVGALIGGVAIGNFYQDSTGGTNYQELIIPVRNSYYDQYIEVFQLHTAVDGSFDHLTSKYTVDSSNLWNYAHKTEPVLAGNLDGDLRLGTPRRYSVSEIVQPLVILNAPPIHFDVFDEENYDICNSYPTGSEFIAEYIKESQQTTEVQTEVNRDWGISASLSSGVSFWGVSVSAHLTQEYGEKFSNVEGSSHTITIGNRIEATVDDQIFSLMIDYDLWEYPIYGNNSLQGQVLVVDPKVVGYRWFDFKSWRAFEYIPNHEVGNILSYRRYPMLSDNPMLVEKIKGEYGLDTSYLLNVNSSVDWYLNFQDFTESQASTTHEFSRDWGVSVSGWGSGISLSGDYNNEDIQTQRTTVESSIDINVHLDAVNMSYGETRYEVTPYAYWATNGALVVDYAVDPEIAGPGGDDTWWDSHYGYLPDPAFILPWRYDPEKGVPISDTKRHQTKDIQFSPQDPADGDVITIHSRVHNFSLLPTIGPVGVRFYIGDPDSGGTLIVNESGESEVFTNGNIAPRGTKEIEIRWRVPEGIGIFPRIFAVIDENDAIAEIHENNNKSWNILQKTTGSTSISTTESIPVKFELSQNYPNPFNPVTTLEIAIPHQTRVSLKIYNLLGEEIHTVYSGILNAGNYQYQWDAHQVASGIYFYQLRAGDYVDVKKMMVMK